METISEKFIIVRGLMGGSGRGIGSEECLPATDVKAQWIASPK